MLYQVSKASKSFGADVVFEDVTFEIRGTEKIALVGRNGCGKTTFLRCISGEESFDKAAVSRQNGITVGYLSQRVLEHDERTVEEELRLLYEPVFALQKRMNELEEKMLSDASDAVLSQYADLQEQFEQMNGYNWEAEMKTVFTRFGFPLEELRKKIGEFSGGQKTRIAFVKLLLSKPDILLLDEPTNHLDLEAIEWLEGYVRNYPKAVVAVSHDRMFLDRISDVVYEMEYGRMKRYSGNYTNYTVQKANDLERQQAAYQRQQKDIERLEALIEKFRYKKNKAAFAQSKIKYLERMDRVEVSQADTRSFKARFTPRLKGGERVLQTEHLQVGYDHVLADVTMEIRRGQRIAILGANGTGKSTFVKTLMGILEPLGGSYLYGHQIETGYFDQQLVQFTGGKTVLEELWDAYPDLDRTTVRSVLGQFLFSADDVFKTTDVLSGGEAVRLSLAKLLLQHANFLILDEPTNHLDIPGKEALEDSLRDYAGTLLFVSHDRYFISRLADSLLVFEDGGAKFIPLTYAEYTEQNAAVEQTRKEEKEMQRAQTPPRALSPESLRREIARTEKAITDKEAEIEEMKALRYEPEYYHDYRKMAELEDRIDDLQNEVEKLMETWEKLSESV